MLRRLTIDSASDGKMGCDEADAVKPGRCVPIEIWGAHAPRVLSLAPRQRLFLIEQEENFGEVPK